MTASSLVTVFCDGCGQWEDASVGDTAREARAGARRAGWRIRRGEDLCPRCARKS